MTVANGCGCPGNTGGVAAAAPDAGRAAGAAAVCGVPDAAAAGAAAPGPPADVVAHPATNKTHAAGMANRSGCTGVLRMEWVTTVSRDG
jgi:hypothetical protein